MISRLVGSAIAWNTSLLTISLSNYLFTKVYVTEWLRKEFGRFILCDLRNYNGNLNHWTQTVIISLVEWCKKKELITSAITGYALKHKIHIYCNIIFPAPNLFPALTNS